MSKSASVVVLQSKAEWATPLWGYYLEIAQKHLGLPLFLLFCSAFIFFIFKKDRFNWLLLGWIVFPVLLFTFVSNKGFRYTAPCLPAMAIVMSVGLTRIQNYNWRRGFYFLTGILAIFSALHSGFSQKDFRIPFLGNTIFGIKRPPVPQLWPINQILDDIVAETKPKKGETITVRTLTNHVYFHREIGRAHV